MAFQQVEERNENVRYIAHRGIVLDKGQRVATVLEEPLSLTAAEFNVLALLMENSGRTLTKEALTEQVLHRKLTAYDRSIDVHISRVRQKLAGYFDGENLIRTIRGIGYQFLSE